MFRDYIQYNANVGNKICYCYLNYICVFYGKSINACDNYIIYKVFVKHNLKQQTLFSMVIILNLYTIQH